MAELFEEVVSLLESRSATRALAGQFRIESEQAAGNGAILGIPVFLATMNEWANDPNRSAALLRVLRSIETKGLQDPGAAIDGRLHEPVGTELTSLLLGGRRGRVATVISTEAGITAASANGLLPPTAWAVMASVADRYGNRIDRQSLIAILSREHKDLIDTGWGPWLDATGDDDVSQAEDFATQQSMGSTQTQVADIGGDSGNYPPPVTRSARVMDDKAAAASAGAATAAAGTGARGTAISDNRAASVHGPVNQRREAATRPEPERFRREPPPNRMPAILGALLLFLLGAAAVYWLLSDRDQVDAGGAAIGDTETSVDGTTEETTPEDGGETTDDETAAPAESIDPAEGPIALDIMMDDPLGRSTSTGVAELRFDVDAGEICYNVNAEQIASPYDGHIHVGPEGVKGGIVVDFGPLDNSDIGCTVVNPAEIELILNDPSGHYVEMHDPSGDFTIRAQLSEAMLDGVAPPQPDVNALFDPSSGGASTRVEAGRLVLVGEVADQETFDRLTGEFADLTGDDGLELVNELVITDGAPLPSGLISIDDSVLFDIGSDELSSNRGTVVADLATVLKTRPAWVATVIGHTDSTGSESFNLALSLRRAEMVRDELIANGVDEDALLIRGAGSTDPIGDNTTAEGRAANRRTELNVDRG